MNADAIRITLLVNDQAGEELTPEHGLSFWIEAEGRRILFDTGQGDALLDNARRLSVPLEKTEFLVLSHGHYDHTGAVASVLDMAPGVRLVLHPQALAPKYSVIPGKPVRSIGIPDQARAAIERVPARNVTWSTEPVSLFSGVGVTGPVPRRTGFEDVGGPFFLDPEGEQKDTLVDDQTLWLVTHQGLIVCAGCCHAGLVNTLNYMRRVTGNNTLRAVMGGFHLVNADDHRLERTLDAVKSMSPGLLVPCHCTGKRAVQVFNDRLEGVVAGRSGMVFRF